MPSGHTAPLATSRLRSSSSSPLTGQLPRYSHPEWTRVGEQVAGACADQTNKWKAQVERPETVGISGPVVRNSKLSAEPEQETEDVTFNPALNDSAVHDLVDRNPS